MRTHLLLICGLLLPSHAVAQDPQSVPSRSAQDARSKVIQMIGSNGSLLIPENQNIPTKWTFAEGVLTASPKWDSVITPQNFRDFRMHIEFNVNDAGDVEHERNGNSGVYIQLRYELQILNSYHVPFESFGKNDCGSIYQMRKPDQFACLPAGEWQSFDIVFRAARFRDGIKSENAKITVYQNKKLIHNNVSLPRHTGAGKKENPEPMPIKLQGHHNQVQFRNFWIEELDLERVPQLTELGVSGVVLEHFDSPQKSGFGSP